MTNQQLWQAILGNLELTLSKANFTTWFKNTSIIEKSETGIVVGVPSAFSKEWLQNKYHQDILKALKQLAPETKEIKYQIVKLDQSDLIFAYLAIRSRSVFMRLS